MKYNPDWTPKQAIEAGGMDEPAGPFWQWEAHHRLIDLERAFCDGDKFALMLALRICANRDMVMPEWVSKAYISAFDRILNYHEKGWNDVFGSPTPKGKHLNALRKERTLAPAVWLEVKRMRDNGMSIGADMFEEIGKRLGLGKTQAEEFYYKFERKVKLSPPSD